MADVTDGWFEEDLLSSLEDEFAGGLQSDYEKEIEKAAEEASELADQVRDRWSDVWGSRRDRNFNEAYEARSALWNQPTEDDDEEDEEVTGHVERFIEAYDIPNRDIPKLTRILDKPHSERTDSEKKLLRKIISKAKKRKKPKIKLKNG